MGIEPAAVWSIFATLKRNVDQGGNANIVVERDPNVRVMGLSTLAKRFIMIYDVQDILVNKQLSSLQFKKRIGKADSGLSRSAIWIIYDVFRGLSYTKTIFILSLGSFVFFDLQKTKYLQIATTILRWYAFGMMIILAIVVIAEGKEHKHTVPLVGTFEAIPNLFGVCVYSFMCHHSLPSLVTPINDKSKIYLFFFGDYAIILLFYLLLSFTAIFAFTPDELQDIYTLTFFNPNNPALHFKPIQYFLALFPVFTLSTNFPIIGITLRNNLRTLFAREGRPYHWVINRLVFPLLALVPPVIVAFVTTNVTELVGITGSYAGAVIQYIIPALMVYYSRRKTKKLFGERWRNKHRSPFYQKPWCIFVMLWAVVCIGFVTADHIISRS